MALHWDRPRLVHFRIEIHRSPCRASDAKSSRWSVARCVLLALPLPLALRLASGVLWNRRRLHPGSCFLRFRGNGCRDSLRRLMRRGRSEAIPCLPLHNRTTFICSMGRCIVCCGSARAERFFRRNRMALFPDSASGWERRKQACVRLLFLNRPSTRRRQNRQQNRSQNRSQNRNCLRLRIRRQRQKCHEQRTKKIRSGVQRVLRRK